MTFFQDFKGQIDCNRRTFLDIFSTITQGQKGRKDQDHISHVVRYSIRYTKLRCPVRNCGNCIDLLH